MRKSPQGSLLTQWPRSPSTLATRPWLCPALSPQLGLPRRPYRILPDLKTRLHYPAPPLPGSSSPVPSSDGADSVGTSLPQQESVGQWRKGSGGLPSQAEVMWGPHPSPSEYPLVPLLEDTRAVENPAFGVRPSRVQSPSLSFIMCMTLAKFLNFGSILI